MTTACKAFAACAVLIVMCLSVLTFWREVQNEKDRKWVVRSHLVVEELDLVHVYVSQAAASQQGYLLTGDDTYLDQYRQDLVQAYRDIGRLRDLTSGNPTQREAINRLDSRITARLTELADEIKVRQRSGLLAGVDAAEKWDVGEESTSAIAAQIGEMRQTETKLSSRLLDGAEVTTRRMNTLVVCGYALGILILVVTGTLIQREAGLRDLAERKLKGRNNRLARQTVELPKINIESGSFVYTVPLIWVSGGTMPDIRAQSSNKPDRNSIR
jgi:CHASE3 domain sensor protein